MRLSRTIGLGFIVCFATLTWACGARTAPPPAIPPANASDTPSPPVSPAPAPAPAPDPPSRPADVAPPPRDVDATECALLPESDERITTVALTETVDPAHAPHPTNDSERLLFRQLYETLVRVDCHGRARPELAASWRLDAGGRTWIVTLRADARFSDGTPVTTGDLVSSWTRRGSGEELRSLVSRHVQSVVPVNDWVIGITLRDEMAEAPLALADTDLAVTKRADGSRWPLGTRLTEIKEDRARPTGRAGLSVVSVTPREPEASDPPSAILFVVAPETDPRDLLDEGVDLLVTREPSTLDYSATLPQFVSVPLAWQRAHLFLSPWRARAARTPSPDARQALAGDAVRGEARGADGPFWWEPRRDCALARSSTA